MGKLTVVKIKSLRKKKPGLYGDGDTLYINVSPNGSLSWVQRLTIKGKPHNIGLGGWPVVSLEKARRSAFYNRVALSDGRDPAAEKRAARKKQAAVPTFKKAAETYYKENLPRWKAGPHTDVWLQPLEKYTFPNFGSKGVDQITRQDLLRLLTPIWTTVPQQAKRLRQRIRMILQWCVAHGFVAQNVCGEVLDGALPSMPVVKEHRRSLPYQDVHHALQLIDSCEATLPSKLCLHFLILTAVRPGEARNAEWSEIDFDNKVWTIPPRKMKMNAEHRVPLSDAALKILERAKAVSDSSTFIFPSPARKGRPLTAPILSRVLEQAGLADQAVAHGFRSTFRTWASEQTNSEHAVMELCLAHRVGSQVEQAYSRSDLLNKRRRLMQHWSSYVMQAPRSKIVSLHG